MDKKKMDEFKVKGEELLSKVKEIIHQGNIRKIIIKNDSGKTYLEVPVTIGVVGLVLAPVWAAIGALAALASSFNIQVIKKGEKEEPEDKEDVPAKKK